MAHHGLQSAYERLTNRLNTLPQGAPPSDVLYKLLAVLFSEREAELVSALPIKPFTAQKAADVWKMGETSARTMLESLADKALLLDYAGPNGEQIYVLPPPMAGFFEFSMMRLRTDVDQKQLSELFYQYLHESDEFIRELFTTGSTQLGRAFVNEKALSDENALHVLPYERATHIIKTARRIGISMCFCRHKMQHLGKACDAPMDICMTFNTSGDSLVRHGYAREVDAAECLDLLDQAYAHNLVQFGENGRQNVNFICNCCGCCCEAMMAARRFGFMCPVHTTNFEPLIQADRCTGCGKCMQVCPVEAMTLVSSNDPHKPMRHQAKLDERQCLGCGVCVRVCPTQALSLKSRPERVITPLDGTHRIVLMAVERGKLQNLLFDNQQFITHRILAQIVGAILRLPPVKQTLARKVLQSRYLEQLIQRKSAP